MSSNQRPCTECRGAHADGQCLVTAPALLPGAYQLDGAMCAHMPARAQLEEAAATIGRLLEREGARLELLEFRLEGARVNVRELSIARTKAKRELRILSQALEVVIAAAATAVSKRRSAKREGPSR